MNTKTSRSLFCGIVIIVAMVLSACGDGDLTSTLSGAIDSATAQQCAEGAGAVAVNNGAQSLCNK